jgi:hypothetical protein
MGIDSPDTLRGQVMKEFNPKEIQIETGAAHDPTRFRETV